MDSSITNSIRPLSVVLIIILLILILLIAEIIREQLTFVITRYHLTSSKLVGLKDGFKIVFLCDLHNRKYGHYNQKLINSIINEKPDLILVGGDMVVAKFKRCYKHALEFMIKLPEICPVYHCNGNHEQRMKEMPDIYGDYEFYKAQLVKSGIRFLENESELVNVNGVTIRISGFEIPMSHYNKENFRKITSETLDLCVGNADEYNYQILLTHFPQLVSVGKAWGADLVLAGHFHGGVMRIPGWRGVITPKLKFFPKYSGELTRDGNQVVIVSKGLGTHTIPVRLFNMAEVVAITFSAD